MLFLESLLPFVLTLTAAAAETNYANKKKKWTKQRKYKNGPKANTTFYILHQSLLIIFLYYYYLTKQSNQKIQVWLTKKSKHFFTEFFGDTGHNKNRSLRCQLSYFALANIQLYKYDWFFKLILMPSNNINIKPDPTTQNNNNKIPLNTLPFYNCHELTMPSKCDSSYYNKEHENSKWNIFKKRVCIFYIWISIA